MNQAARPAPVEVHFLNVGQGDTTLIIDNERGTATVVDCHSAATDQALALINAAGLRLTHLVITHFHYDHMSGAGKLLDRHPDAIVLVNPPSMQVTTPQARTKAKALLRQLKRYAQRGCCSDNPNLRDGTFGTFRYTCLAPDHTLLMRSATDQDPNTASIVLLLEAPGLRLLLAADTNAYGWLHVLTSDPRADVLRVSHHGGELQPVGVVTPADVLAAVRPSARIVSVGTGNGYGHPRLGWVAPHPAGGRARCTQVTALCHNGLSAVRSAGCAGTTVVRWWPHTWTIEPAPADHDAVIDGWSHPACRPAPAPCST